MLRVLTLSSLFPDKLRPTFGGFVERQTLGLAAMPEVELRVVAPIGLPPRPFSYHPHYRPLLSLPKRERWKGLDVYRPHFPVIPKIGSHLSPALMAHALIPLFHTIYAEFPFDVIDTQFFFPDGPAAMRLSKALGIPFSIKARGGDIHFWSGHKRCNAEIITAGKAAHGMLAVSSALRSDMIALGMPPEKISVHHTGVDQAKFKPLDRESAKAKLGISGPLIASIGYLIERKGQTLVIDAMRDLPDATLLIIGQGPDREKLQAQAQTIGVADRVRFLGPLPHEAIPAILAAADVTALPSASEGLANVWVESLACGTPIVIADVGGAREVIDRPEAGYLVERTGDAVARAIAALIQQPPPQSEVIESAKKFSWERNADALLAHLRKIATKGL